MKLTISKVDGWFLVDDDSRPGSPCIGRGRTMKEAIGDHIHANQTSLGITFEVHESARPAEMRRRAREMRKR